MKNSKLKIPERILLFEGCTTSRVLNETRLATYIILEKAVEKGIIKEYKIIPNERCCGYASMVVGDFETQKANLMFNINAMTRLGIYDVLFTCGACTQFIGNDPEFKRRGFRSINILEFVYALAKTGNLEKLMDRKLPAGTKITGHYACHLARLSGLRMKMLYKEIARALGADYVEMKDASDCCGAGSEGQVAMKIAKRKVENAAESGADLAPMVCAGCEAMLSVAAKQNNIDVKFISLSSLIASCFNDLDKWIEKLGGTLKEPTPRDAPSAAEKTLESMEKSSAESTAGAEAAEKPAEKPPETADTAAKPVEAKSLEKPPETKPEAKPAEKTAEAKPETD